MYRVNVPLRIVEIEDDRFLMSVPKTGLRFEINKNTAGFIEYLQDKETFDSVTIGEYAALKQISDTGDYEALVVQMADAGVLVEA